MKIAFVVLGPPVPCPRPRVTKHGTYLPAHAEAYQALVKDHAMIAAYKLGFPWEARATAYAITLRFFKGSGRRADFDNLAKSVTDPLSKLLYPDDSAIVEAHVYVRVDRARPRAEIELETVP